MNTLVTGPTGPTGALGTLGKMKNPDERPSKFTQYRYLRWPWDNRVPQLAFLVNVDHDKNEIEFTVAICNESDNFDFKAAHKILNARMKSKSNKYRFTVPYNRKETLMQNMFNHLTDEYESAYVTARLHKMSGAKTTKAFKDRLDFLRLTLRAATNISYFWLKHYNEQIGDTLFAALYYHIKHNWLHYPIPHVVYPDGMKDKLSLIEYKDIALACYF